MTCAPQTGLATDGLQSGSAWRYIVVCPAAFIMLIAPLRNAVVHVSVVQRAASAGDWRKREQVPYVENDLADDEAEGKEVVTQIEMCDVA